MLVKLSVGGARCAAAAERTAEAASLLGDVSLFEGILAARLTCALAATYCRAVACGISAGLEEDLGAVAQSDRIQLLLVTDAGISSCHDPVLYLLSKHLPSGQVKSKSGVWHDGKTSTAVSLNARIPGASPSSWKVSGSGLTVSKSFVRCTARAPGPRLASIVLSMRGFQRTGTCARSCPNALRQKDSVERSCIAVCWRRSNLQLACEETVQDPAQVTALAAHLETKRRGLRMPWKIQTINSRFAWDSCSLSLTA